MGIISAVALSFIVYEPSLMRAIRCRQRRNEGGVEGASSARSYSGRDTSQAKSSQVKRRAGSCSGRGRGQVQSSQVQLSPVKSRGSARDHAVDEGEVALRQLEDVPAVYGRQVKMRAATWQLGLVHSEQAGEALYGNRVQMRVAEGGNWV